MCRAAANGDSNMHCGGMCHARHQGVPCPKAPLAVAKGYEEKRGGGGVRLSHTTDAESVPDC